MGINDYIQLGILFVALISIAVSCFCNYMTIKTTRKLNKMQHQFQFFIEYTRRYRDIIQMKPDSFETLTLENSDIRKYFSLYFDLCNEKYYLHSREMIEDDVWGLWVERMKTVMSDKKYKTAWKKLGLYYDNTNFVHFMNELSREEKKLEHFE